MALAEGVGLKIVFVKITECVNAHSISAELYAPMAKKGEFSLKVMTSKRFIVFASCSKTFYYVFLQKHDSEGTRGRKFVWLVSG